ncbi:hypothetical protein Q4S45_21420 [Massilia sp. R2A-15]|uniref:hypothetical protein n=1 Tax=Massilia sp. R2A-15 TaxID=3064278 RepID=UPI0027348A0A|nr:hypothetical protein [Massilia sp. R2A-15]WLI89224.1 hypothetical protein Q4S45_21420 [Massilia sp. R2A-15]
MGKPKTKTTGDQRRPYDFPALEQQTRTHVSTACAAFYLTRAAQTLRSWACLENGPLRPVRINGRLAWSVADIKRLLNGGR